MLIKSCIKTLLPVLMKLTWFVLLCSLGRSASAQHTSTLKYQVYSDYLNARIAANDSLMDTTYVRKSRSVFITPMTKWDARELKGATSTIQAYLQSKGIWKGQKLPDPALSVQAAAGMLDFWPQSSPKGQLRSWLDASPDNVRLYFQLDSLVDVHQVIRPLFRLNYGIIIGTSPSEAFKKKPDWEGFYSRWPGSFGIVTLSEIAFTADKRRAVFYVAERQGGLAGGGNIVFMVSTPHGWEVEFTVNLWVS